MQLSNHSYLQQSILASYCRTGNYQALAEVNEKHVHHYRRLIYNIINDSLSSSYPLAKNLLMKDEWNKLVNDFFANHACESPQVWNMPGELIGFVGDTNHSLMNKYPFLQELLQFEWLEVEVYMMEDEVVPAYSLSGNYQKENILLNPEIRLAGFTFPVHLKNASDIKHTHNGHYYVSLHRDPDSGKVRFTDLKIPHVQLIDYLHNGGANYKNMLQIFMRYAAETDAQEALNSFIEASLKSRLILGFFINN